jgi:phosphatidylserine synthase
VVCALIVFFCTRDMGSEVLGVQMLGKQAFDWIVVSMPLVLVTLGLLMVSRVPYPHAVSAIVRKRHSFPFLAGLVVLIVIAAIEWQLALAVVTIGYVLSGLLLGLYRTVTRGRMDGPDGDADGGDDGSELLPRRDPMLN